MMNELPGIALALVAGAGLGVIFFGGLWLTLTRLPTTRWPMLLALGSLVGRMAITVIGLYLITSGSWQRLAACVVGLILSRQILIRRLHPPSSTTKSIEQA